MSENNPGIEKMTINLHKWYMFHKSAAPDIDLSGVWLTISSSQISYPFEPDLTKIEINDQPIWTLQRILSVSKEAPVGVEIKLHSFCFIHYGKVAEPGSFEGIFKKVE